MYLICKYALNLTFQSIESRTERVFKKNKQDLRQQQIGDAHFGRKSSFHIPHKL